MLLHSQKLVHQILVHCRLYLVINTTANNYFAYKIEHLGNGVNGNYYCGVEVGNLIKIRQ